MRTLGILIGLLLAILLLGLLTTAFTSAQANLAAAHAMQAQAQASQFQSLTAIIGQCISGAAVVLALITGVRIGTKAQAVKGLFPGNKKTPTGQWLSGPNARWQRLNAAPKKALPDGDLLNQLLLLELERRQQDDLHMTEMEIIEVDDDGNDDFADYKDWGW